MTGPRFAYVDSSCLVAIAFDEPSAPEVKGRLTRFDRLVSANLLEAEVRSALIREEVRGDPVLLGAISWVTPDRPLSEEIQKVLEAGYVRGAACWQLATALYLAGGRPGELSFVTLDRQQKAVAAELGFRE